MFKILKKGFYYFKACHRGEILKKIEYKIKDKIGYFYIRNKMQSSIKNIRLTDCKIDFPEIKELQENYEYEIFGKKFFEEDIISFLKSNKQFWRKIKLNNYEDVKIIWEYNRLQFLLPIAIKYAHTKKEKYKSRIISILDFWIKNNEFECTINWNNNLEVAIRAINVALCLLLLQDTELNNKYSKCLFLHAKHIYSEINYSDCCIPNNHVIGEATSLLFLSRILDVKENKKWYKKSIKILERYINIIDDDGVSKENSFSYQFFVTKMYILNLCFIKEKELFEKVNEKIRKSLNFLKWTIINENEILNYGDNDDGFLFSIYNRFNIAKDIEEYYNLFSNNTTCQETKLYKEIFSTFNPQKELNIEKSDEKKDFILTKNIFIYKWNNNILFFNAKNIEGHAHNDSLAINFVVNGKEVLLDAGTYSYNKSKEERKFYRGREAHNTIQLEDNAEQIGSFRWVNKNKSYISFFREDDNKLEIEGIIEKLASRKVIIDKKKNEINIIDKIIDKNNIKINWIINIEEKIDELRTNFIEINFDKDAEIAKKKVEISKRYLEKRNAMLYRVHNSKKNNLKTVIYFVDNNREGMRDEKK